MTAEALTSILVAELETGTLLAETLDRQRRALLERDLAGVSEATEILEGQIEHLRLLVAARVKTLEDSDGRLSDECAELLRRIRQTEARIARLVGLNQDLIADRLAWTSAMLSTIGITGAAGYGPDAHSAALSRSA